MEVSIVMRVAQNHPKSMVYNGKFQSKMDDVKTGYPMTLLGNFSDIELCRIGFSPVPSVPWPERIPIGPNWARLGISQLVTAKSRNEH